MSKKLWFAAVAALVLAGGSRVFSGTPSCTPSRANILTGPTVTQPENGTRAVSDAPTCAPSRVDILTTGQ